jgi:flagellar hook-length control protein FliK
MDTPQDLMKLVPPSPGGNATPRGPADTARKTDGGADFAEAMRSARETNRPESREVDAREPQARQTQGPQAADQKAREAPDEASDEPVYASKDKGLPDQAERTDGAARSTADNQPGAVGFQLPAAASETAQAVVALVAPPFQPLADSPSVSTPDADAAGTPINAIPAVSNGSTPVQIAALSQPGTAQPASDTRNLPSLAEQAPQSLAVPATGDGASTQPVDTAPLQVPSANVTADKTLPATPRAPAAAEALARNASATAPATAAQAVAVAPAAVALVVDRAVGNALVNRPATGNFKPADLAAPVAADPARIASAGFVAAALQPATAEAVTAPMSPLGEPMVAADAAEQSIWLSVRPDSLAMALADRALSQDAVAQLPAELDQMMQSLDAKLVSVTGTSLPVGLPGVSDAEAPVATLAAADAQPNGALQIQPQGVAADNAPEPVSLSLNAPMQQAGRWATELGDRMAWVANNRFNSATLQVNPPQLGPIEVRIQMSGDQAAVSFAAVQPQTREAIQQALPVLASSFASQGLSLGQTSVGRDHLPQQGGQGGSGGNSSAQPGLVATSIESVGSAPAGSPTRGGNGLVDTFA